MAERGRFELPEACASAVFKTAALNHSTISPRQHHNITPFSRFFKFSTEEIQRFSTRFEFPAARFKRHEHEPADGIRGRSPRAWLNFIWQCLAVWGKFRKQYPPHPHFIAGSLIVCALVGLVIIKKIIQEGVTLPVLGNSISMVAPACLIVFSLGAFPVNVIERDSLKKRLFRMLLIDLVYVFVLGVMFLAQITGILKF